MMSLTCIPFRWIAPQRAYANKANRMEVYKFLFRRVGGKNDFINERHVRNEEDSMIVWNSTKGYATTQTYNNKI